MKKKRVLIGSPVYQKPDILSLFLQSLKNLQRETVRLDYVFVDDNLDPAASKLLKDFSRSGSQVTIFDGKKRGGYHRDEETHYWNYALMLKVANYKNKIIEYALKQDYDYLFFVDSDLLLHPYLLEHLKACNKQIISEIFWT
ncbi:MAG TPA: glycosyltransferase family 2 protein, partial [Clostridia bacterium]|nr:glycosyltransferase family 2 protein [Clostridia bacterium]